MSLLRLLRRLYPGSNKIDKRERFDKTIHGGLSPGVMEDQPEAITVTAGLTDTVYLDRPTGIRTVNSWISQQQPCILPQGYLVKSLTIL